MTEKEIAEFLAKIYYDEFYGRIYCKSDIWFSMEARSLTEFDDQISKFIVDAINEKIKKVNLKTAIKP